MQYELSLTDVPEHVVDRVTFEQPLNERTRSLLRLEFLFAQYAHHHADASRWGLRASLHTMLDLLAVIGRADLKTDLSKELGEQETHLRRLRARAEVDRDKLDRVLADIRAALAALQTLGAHPSAMLRENEFLFSILNRSAIPGGTCDFDLPAYHRWLSRSHAATERDLGQWFSHLAPLQGAIRLYLQLLRDSAVAEDCLARGGVHLHVPPANCQLVRVALASDADVYPEISAGRHRFSFRFMTLGNVDSRNVQTTEDIAFRLQCCMLSGA